MDKTAISPRCAHTLRSFLPTSTRTTKRDNARDITRLEDLGLLERQDQTFAVTSAGLDALAQHDSAIMTPKSAKIIEKIMSHQTASEPPIRPLRFAKKNVRDLITSGLINATFPKRKTQNQSQRTTYHIGENFTASIAAYQSASLTIF